MNRDLLAGVRARLTGDGESVPRTLDTRIDFESDTPPGKDSDAFSPTLRQYHRVLWSRELPIGGDFDLVAKGYRPYLSHLSPLGDFALSSDICVPGFLGRDRMESIINETPYRAIDEFEDIRGTIGGRMIWPSRTIGKIGTINGMRGWKPRISDRWDLTVECVRRHYAAQDSPLSKEIGANSAFFDLFVDFRGFVDFFLLQDIVSSDYESVRFMIPFDGFTTRPLPADAASYKHYLAEATAYIRARNARIDALKIPAP